MTSPLPDPRKRACRILRFMAVTPHWSYLKASAPVLLFHRPCKPSVRRTSCKTDSLGPFWPHPSSKGWASKIRTHLIPFQRHIVRYVIAARKSQTKSKKQAIFLEGLLLYLIFFPYKNDGMAFHTPLDPGESEPWFLCGGSSFPEATLWQTQGRDLKVVTCLLSGE